METNFKLEKLDLIKVPVIFPFCDGCIFYRGDNSCELAKMPEQLKQKIKVRIQAVATERLCPDDTKFVCSRTDGEGKARGYIFLYSRY